MIDQANDLDGALIPGVERVIGYTAAIVGDATATMLVHPICGAIPAAAMQRAAALDRFTIVTMVDQIVGT